MVVPISRSRHLVAQPHLLVGEHLLLRLFKRVQLLGLSLLDHVRYLQAFSRGLGSWLGLSREFELALIFFASVLVF